MTPRNWGRIGGHLRWSYATLGNFANDIYDFLEKEGRFPGNLEMRADHYRGRAKAIFHKTLAIVQEWPDLPAYPGDGSTQCLSNCLCNWVVERTPDAWHCYWTLGLAEHCQDCVARSQIWNPLVIPLVSGRSSRLVRCGCVENAPSRVLAHHKSDKAFRLFGSNLQSLRRSDDGGSCSQVMEELRRVPWIKH